MLGWHYREKERYDLAEQEYRAALKLKPDDLDTLYRVFDEAQFLGAPVIDEDGVLLGVVERSAVAEATIDHAEADHMKSLGIASGEELRSMPPFERSRRRLSWLSINVVLNLIAASVIAAYEETLRGAIALAVFAFTTLIGWSYYCERSWQYLLGVKAIIPFRIVWSLAPIAGATVKLSFVWLLADTLNALMAIPNLIALALLSPVVFAIAREFFATRGKSENNPF